MNTQRIITTLKQSFDLPTMLLVFLSIIPFILLIKGIVGISRNIQVPNTEASMSISPAVPISTCKPYVMEIASEGFIPTQITIPSLSLNLPIQTVNSHTSRTVIATDSAIYSKQTSRVQQEKGNVGIYGLDKLTVLSSIRKLLIDEKILLTSKEYTATYTVSETGIRDVSTDFLFASKASPTLTLISTGKTLYEKKYILRAKLLSITSNCYETTQ